MKRHDSIARHGARTLFALAAMTCALPMLAQAASPAPTAKPAPMRVAEQRKADLRLGATAIGRTYAVRTADATFVKLHLDHFSLPDGVTLEVSNPARTEVYRYSNQGLDGHTVDRDMGQNGRTSFSAMSIHGPVALVRLVGTPTSAWKSSDGIRITRYLQGYSERKLRELQLDAALGATPSTRSIQGTDDKRPAACYSSSDPAAFDRSRPVARLVMSSGGLCTAWRVGPDNRMFTNNHCIATASATASAEVWFNYQLSTCGGTSATPTKVAGDQMLRTDTTLDYTLYTVKNFATIASFGYLGLETRTATLNEEIMIAGHPGGRQKELSVVSDRDGGGRCRVNSASTSGNGTNTDIGYYCDTEGGSSGSPVIARSSHKAIALHHLGGSMNKGAKISLIWPQVSTHFGGVVPDGDNGTTPTTYSVSGTITTSAGAGIANVVVSTGSTSATTNSSGAYTLSGLSNGTYTLTPSLGGYTFSPASRSVTVSGANVSGQSFTGTSTGTLPTYTNGTDYAINDNSTVSSPITVTGRTGNGQSSTPVTVNIIHTYRGDLVVDLVAPDGSVYNLLNRSGGSADNVNQTFNVNLSGEALNGTWNLRVRDAASADTGRIDSWSIMF
ncbi:MAG: proprotein convertase P-domain-containing protein [Xanthomonadaceae bacterium]|nr:proprotein convertase P-domain-containing protein [Xanthomonadaceae bacterium]